MKETISILLEKINWDKEYFNDKVNLMGDDYINPKYQYYLGKLEYSRQLIKFLEDVLKHI